MKSRTILVAAMLAAVPAAHGQSAWLAPATTSQSIAAELERPAGLNGATPVWLGFATYRWKLEKYTGFVVELPVHGVIASAGDPVLGNPYVGVRTIPTASLHEQYGFWEFGVRLPLGSDLATSGSAFVSNPIDRRNAMRPNVVSMAGAYNIYHQRTSGIITRIRVGLNAATSSRSGTGSAGELLFVYAGQVGWSGDSFRGVVGVSGGGIVNSNGGSFADRTIHQLGLQASYNHRSLTPGIQLRIPLDEIFNTFDYVLGFNLTVALGKTDPDL